MNWGRGPWWCGYPPPNAPSGVGYGGYWGYGPTREEEKLMLENRKRWLEDQKRLMEKELTRIDRSLAELETAEQSSDNNKEGGERDA